MGPGLTWKRRPSGCRFATGVRPRRQLPVAHRHPGCSGGRRRNGPCPETWWHVADRESHQLQHGMRRDALGQGCRQPTPLLSDRQLSTRTGDVDRVSRHSRHQPPSPLEHVSARAPRRWFGSDPFRRARTHGRRTGFSRAWLCACALVPGHGVAEAPILR
jgi:hypothetical protein